MKSIIALILFAVVTFVTSLGIPTAVAAPLKAQRIEVIRPGEGKTFRLGTDFITEKMVSIARKYGIEFLD